jgi:hypothetical protein
MEIVPVQAHVRPAESGTQPLSSLTRVYGPSLSLSEGVPFNGLVARFTYPQAPALVADSIAWGDGSSSTLTVIPYADGQVDLQGNHVYQTTGLLSITIQVTWADGTSLVIYGSAVVGLSPVAYTAVSAAGTSSLVLSSVYPSSAGGYAKGPAVLSEFQLWYGPAAPSPHGGPGPAEANLPPPGKSDMPPGIDRGSPAVSFRAILFSVSANTPLGPSVSITVAASMPSGPTTAGLHSRADGLFEHLSAPQIEAHEDWEPSQKPDLQTPSISQTNPSASRGLDSPFVGNRWEIASAVTAVFEQGGVEDWTAFRERLLNGLPDEEPDKVVAAVALAAPSKIPLADEGAAKASHRKQSNQIVATSDWRDLGEQALVLFVLVCVTMQERRREENHQLGAVLPAEVIR